MTTSPQPLNVLFLCTHNSARSILGEAILNRIGVGRFRGFSAGSDPAGRVHPFALDLLQRLDYPIDGLRSKSWDEFAKPDAPKMDFVFTVCDDAANETCPVWPGQPISAHWGMPDPSAAAGGEVAQRLVFADTYRMLNQRIDIFTSLPFDTLSDQSLRNRLKKIGASLTAEATND